MATKTLVLLRHGESVWNRENRFTGWTDVGLTDKGHEEAVQAGRSLQRDGFAFDVAFTSVLKRSIKTLWLVLEEMDQMWIPVRRSWPLNERHYGALQGESKAEMAERMGAEQVHQWHRKCPSTRCLPLGHAIEGANCIDAAEACFLHTAGLASCTPKA